MKGTPENYRLTPRTLLMAGGALMLLGCTVMLGWHLGAERVTSIIPGLDPMPYTTAFTFVVAGAALIALARGWTASALAGGAVVVVIGLSTLLEHITGVTILPRLAVVLPPPDGGRLASPNLALSLVVAGVGVVLLARGGGALRRFTVTLLGTGAAIIAGVDLLGYLVTMDGHPGGFLLPQMALHTALGTCLLGSVLCYAGWRLPAAPGAAWRTRWPYAASVTVCLLSVLLAQLLRANERRQIRASIETAAQGVAFRVERSFARQRTALTALARFWPEFGERGSATAAEATLLTIPGRHAIAWLGADGGARWVAGAAPAPEWLPAEALRREGALAADGLILFDRREEQTRLGMLVPVSRGARLLGHLWLVSDSTLGLLGELSARPLDLGVEVRDARGVLLRVGETATAQSALWGTEAAVILTPIVLTVRAWPSAAALRAARSTLPILTLATGMLVAMLLGLSLALGRAARLRAQEAEEAHGRLRDQIRDREAAEAALARSEQQLQQAQKLEAVGRLAGGIAHDYNNLLTVIRGNVRTLLLQGGFSGLAAEALEHADRAAARGTLLTSRLLAFSQRQLLQPEAVSVGDLVAEQREALAQLLGPQVRLELERLPGADVVLVDRRWLAQVVLDLAFNAFEAMPLGGTLHLRTQPATAPLRAAYGVAQPPDPAVVLEIEDSGQGMDEVTRGRLFEPFFSTKRFGQGSGLALATAYGIVRQSGGEIAVQSVPSTGTRVGIFLPAADGAAASAPGGGPLGGLTVLVAEDEPGVLRLLVRVLEASGCRVLAGGSAEEALVILSGHAGRLDLLVTDIVMPGMSGVELADQVRAGHPGLPVLFVSAYTSDALREQGIASLGAYLLQKPFTSEELLGQVRRTLGRYSSGSPAR